MVNFNFMKDEYCIWGYGHNFSFWEEKKNHRTVIFLKIYIYFIYLLKRKRKREQNQGEWEKEKLGPG